MNNLNVDLYNKNLEACLKTVSKIGSTDYWNICENTVKSVPWGALDWVATLGIIIGGISLILFFVRIFMEIFDY